MSALSGSIRFHFRNAGFNASEQFSDLGSGLTGFLLFPFFIWLLAQIWGRFNGYLGNYTLHEVMLYVGVNEILFMTFLRSNSLSRASSDFSLALARPRSWLVSAFSGMFGRSLGARLVYLGIFVVTLPLLGVDFSATLQAAWRLLWLLPLLGIFQAGIGLLFASGQVAWFETRYLVLPISKIFLALGGVFGPLSDYGEPWRSVLLQLPPADLFFQVGYFCVRGEFFGMSAMEWSWRLCALAGMLVIANGLFFRYAKSRHQSHGG